MPKKDTLLIDVPDGIARGEMGDWSFQTLPSMLLTFIRSGSTCWGVASVCSQIIFRSFFLLGPAACKLVCIKKVAVTITNRPSRKAGLLTFSKRVLCRSGFDLRYKDFKLIRPSYRGCLFIILKIIPTRLPSALT